MTGGKKLKIRSTLSQREENHPEPDFRGIGALECMSDSMADPDGQDRGKASEAQPGYTHNPRDTRDRQSSRFYCRMERVSHQRKLTAVITYVYFVQQVTLFLSVNSKNAHHYKSFGLNLN